MNRAGLIVVVAALLFAIAPSWTSLAVAAPAVAPEKQEARTGSMTIAALIDASVKNTDVMSQAASGQYPLDGALRGRDVQVIYVDRLVDSNEAALLSDLLNASDVLQMNVILVHGAAAIDGALSSLLAAHDIPVDRVVAIDLAGDDTAKLVTVYLFPY
jgi:hypothetical protein